MHASRPVHVVLLGDSIFDNAAYVGDGPDVIAQLRELLPEGWRATLAAVDGAFIDGVARQLGAAPPDATHLVISAGGNDALAHIGLLDRRARTSAEVLGWFSDAVEGFRERYDRMLAAVARRGLPALVCTIYNGNLGAPTQRLATVALALFNDAIIRAARAHDVPVLELRDICDEARDYANAIEPSVQGGEKLAHAVARALLTGI